MKFGLTKITLGLIAVSFGLFSCGEEDKTADLKHSTEYNMFSSIENLTTVMSIDVLGIIEKSDFESNPDLPMEASAGYKMLVKNKIDPELTGINLSGNNHIAVAMGEDGEPEFICFSAKVTNYEKVKGTLKDVIKGTYTKEDLDGTEYNFIVDDEVCVGWDDKDVVLVYSRKEDVLKKTALGLLEARFKDGADGNPLEQYLEQVDDFNVFVSFEGLIAAAEKNSKKEIPAELKENFEEAYYIGKGNFNTGEIKFEWDVYAEKIANSEYNALGAGMVHDSFKKYLTNDKLIGFGTASIDMAAIFNALELVPNNEFDFGKIEQATGLDKAALQKMFTGEFAFSAIDMKTGDVVMADPDDFFAEQSSFKSEIPLVVFTAGISDSSQIGSLLRMTKEFNIVNGVYELDKEAYLALQGDKLIISTDRTTAEFFASGNSFVSYEAPIDEVADVPLFGYLNTDVKNMPNGVLKLADTEEGQMGLEFINLFDGVTFTGKFEHMEFNARMKNKNDNALKTITDFVIKMVKDKNMI